MPYARTRLGRFFYEEHGEPRRKGDPAIVLLHGLLFDGGMWKGQIEALSALGRVVVIDGPGHGRSEPPPRFSLEDHALALFDAFGELGISKALVVGLSWGGMTGMRFALAHPELVAGLALLDTSAEAPTLIERIRYRLFLSLHRRVGMPMGMYKKQIAPLMFSARTLASRQDLVESTYRHFMGFDRDGFTRAGLAVVVKRGSVLPRLGEIRVPTLVIVGSEDLATVPALSEHMAAAIPGAQLIRLEGLGHMTALEGPAQVNEVLLPFVQKVLAEA